jgi:thioredoxin-dependent peroxiredoxin
VVFGVSLDGAASHQRFHEKECLPFDLLVDVDGSLCRLYEVPVTNLLLVKLAARVSYLIGKNGRILRTFDKVDPRGHAAEVLAAIDAD